MTCEQFHDDFELYALGVLEPERAGLLADHLATGCASCHESLRQALEQIRIMSSTVPLVDPPARLRRRIQQAIAPATSNRRWASWAALVAALIILTVGLTLIMRRRVSETANQRRVSTALQILGAPGTQAFPFTIRKAPEIHGAVYVHQKLGAALVIDSLGKAPTGWKYESWVVPKGGNPEPIESFSPDASGRAVSLVPGPIDMTRIGALAVSMEPENSQPLKPTTVVFAAGI